MLYRFQKGNGFLNFRDVFYDYSRKRQNLLTAYLGYTSEYHSASYHIGAAHFTQFSSRLHALEPSPLAKEENDEAWTAFLEMNIAVIRHEIETGRNHYGWETERDVRSHQRIFPCNFSHKGACSVSLPERYEELLTRIIAFQEALIHDDIAWLVTFLDTHCLQLDKDWASERLRFLSRYYQAGKYMVKHHDELLLFRRNAQ